LSNQTKKKMRKVTRRKATTTPTRRRSRRSLSARFGAAKVQKGVNVALQGAIGGALAAFADKQLPPLVGLTPGQGYGALIAAVAVGAFTNRDNIAAGMAGAAGAIIGQNFGLADGYGNGISFLNRSNAKQLLTSGGGLSELADNMERSYAPNYSL
jgi:hypothetical protein